MTGRRLRLTSDQLIADALALLSAAGALPVLLTVAEAAGLAGVSTEAIRVWCRAGILIL